MIDRNACKITADAFFKTACMIDDMPSYREFKNEMLGPFTVNLMLSCELYLKYLLFPYVDLEKKKYHTHDIEFLFTQLEAHSNEITRVIRKYYNEAFLDGVPLHELNELLELSKKTLLFFVTYMNVVQEGKCTQQM